VGPDLEVYHRGAFIGSTSEGTRSVFLTHRFTDTTLFEQGVGSPSLQKGPRKLCAQCFENYVPPIGHGPFSSTDQRRITTVKIDSSWDTSPGTPDSRIVAAALCAIGRWNIAEDAWRHQTGFFFALDQNGFYGYADITIVKGMYAGAPANTPAATVPGGANKLSTSTLWLHARNTEDEAITDEVLCGRVAHEFAHKLGGAHWGTCPLQWTVLSGHKIDFTRWVNSVTPLDVELVNQALMYPATCTATMSHDEPQ